MTGVLLTSLYTFRMIFLVFFGEQHSQVTYRPGNAILIPCLVLAFLSIVGGYLKAPFASFLGTSLPWNSKVGAVPIGETASGEIAAAVFFLGVYLAYVLFLRKPDLTMAVASSRAGRVLHSLWSSDWAMDWLYDRLFVRPLVWLANSGKSDLIDGFYAGVAWLNKTAWRGASRTQSGRLRWYAAGIAAGSIVLIAVVLFL